MKTIRGRDGRERLWFEEGEIDRAMEAELRKASLLPTSAEPAVDIERFIEKYLGAKLDQYADLDHNVLGLTEFFDGAPPKVSINRALTGSALDEDESPPGVRGRHRATLAHEAAHIVLHRSLFELAAPSLELFSAPANPRVHAQEPLRCLKRNASFAPVADWREFQANEGMAALLMPRSIFLPIARGLVGGAFPGRTTVPRDEAWRVARPLSESFKVSKQAATIRLETLGLADRGQTSLSGC